MASDQEWAAAYALQALSDLHARDILLAGKGDRCHTLHYLQMAAEKVCKAYLVDRNGEGEVRKIHGYVQAVLPVFARLVTTRSGARLQAWQVAQVRVIAREIEILAPACHEENTRPDNCEYPWTDAGGRIYVPCRYAFPSIKEDERILVIVIQLLRVAAQQYVSLQNAAGI